MLSIEQNPFLTTTYDITIMIIAYYFFSYEETRTRLIKNVWSTCQLSKAVVYYNVILLSTLMQ